MEADGLECCPVEGQYIIKVFLILGYKFYKFSPPKVVFPKANKWTNETKPGEPEVVLVSYQIAANIITVKTQFLIINMAVSRR